LPQLRQNIITGDWVVIAPERAKRPRDFVIPKGVEINDPAACPFCPENDNFKHLEKIRKASNRSCFAVENRYPAFIEDESQKSQRSYYIEDDFYRAKASRGDHEVIVMKDHHQPLNLMPQKVIEDMLEMLRDRYLCMRDKEGLASIMPIYNHGPEAGASILHPHAQIFGSGIVSNTVGREMDGAEKYYGINSSCVYCDMVKHERRQKTRVVYENGQFIAINFFASRFPFETWILPKNHESQFEETTKTSMSQFATALHEVVQKVSKTLDNPSLNWYIHTLPALQDRSASYHWHLELIPRVSNFGGFELGSEVIINVMSPEEATKYLKS